MVARIHTTGFLTVPENAPSAAELKAITKNSTVKVAHNGERFWTVVTKVGPQGITAFVDNVLVGRHPFKAGDLIRFQPKNVYDIHDAMYPG